MQEALAHRAPAHSSITIGYIDKALDNLNRAKDKSDKTAVLRDLLQKTTALQQKWLVRISKTTNRRKKIKFKTIFSSFT